MSNQSGNPDDVEKSTKSASTEHYDRISATLRDSSILMAGSSILFGFLLNIELNSLKSQTFVDGVILLASIYSVTIATALFIMPVIFHQRHYQMFDVQRFLSRSKKFLLGGTSLLMLTMYLTLGLVLRSTVSSYVAFTLAAFPFIFIAVVLWFNRKS
jgi:Family of unknown function (DUF6328)